MRCDATRHLTRGDRALPVSSIHASGTGGRGLERSAINQQSCSVTSFVLGAVETPFVCRISQMIDSWIVSATLTICKVCLSICLSQVYLTCTLYYQSLRREIPVQAPASPQLSTFLSTSPFNNRRSYDSCTLALRLYCLEFLQSDKYDVRLWYCICYICNYLSFS